VFDLFRIACATPARRARLLLKGPGDVDQRAIKGAVQSLFRSCKSNKPLAYEIAHDNSGKQGDASDITLCFRRNLRIGISLKRNNASIKHPRPNALGRQLALEDTAARLYKKKFNAVTTAFAKRSAKGGKAEFCDVPQYERARLYRSVNRLVAATLRKATPDQQLQFVCFLLSVNTKPTVVMTYSDKTRACSFMRIRDLQSLASLKMGRISVKEHCLNVAFGDVKLRLRLHNASKTVGVSPSIKYDVTLVV
jgi:hypothetical protein